MKEIFSLLNKNKKDIISYFENNNIKYKYEKNNFIYETIIFEEKFTIEIRLFHKTTTSIRVICTSIKSANYERFLNLINSTKDYANNIYGMPNSDSTNHMSETVEMLYSNEDSMIYISGNNGIHNNNKYSFEIHIHRLNAKIKDKVWPRILIYLAGGLLWGFFMFLSMAHGQYNWVNFGIWMSGGLLFAVLFGLIYELVMRIENRDKLKSLHKYDNKFNDYEASIKYELSLNGILYPKTYQARLYLNEDKALVVYYKNGLKIIETNLKNIDDKLINHFFPLESGKKANVFNLENKDELIQLIDYINSKLYNNERYISIYQKIDKIIKEYNPYSLLNRNINIFKYIIFIISKEMYNSPNMTLANIKDLIYEMFDYDMDNIMVSELSELIIKQLNI